MVGAGHQQVGMMLDPGQALYSRAYHFVSIRYDARYIVTLLPVIRGKEGNRDNLPPSSPGGTYPTLMTSCIQHARLGKEAHDSSSSGSTSCGAVDGRYAFKLFQVPSPSSHAPS
jgi:hypothetical protein